MEVAADLEEEEVEGADSEVEGVEETEVEGVDSEAVVAEEGEEGEGKVQVGTREIKLLLLPKKILRNAVLWYFWIFFVQLCPIFALFFF